MRILLLSLVFDPDVSANSYAMTTLAEGLVELGHEMTVLTAMPHYGEGAIYEDYRGRLFMDERREGLRILRTYLYVPRRKDWRLGKALSWLSFNVIATPLAMLLGRHDVAITLPPPFTLGLTQMLVKALRGIPYVYNVQDVYPDIAVQQGVLVNEQIIRFMRFVEDITYRHATFVTVISENLRANLLAKGVPPEKLAVIPNSFDTDLVFPEARDNEFAKEYDLSGRFVVMYAGNVGDSLGVETLFETARLLADKPDILFVVVGRGIALHKLQRMCRQVSLTNVRFLPFQHRDRVSKMYASSDLQLMLQKRGLAQSSAPTKILSIMASGRPIIASTDVESEGAVLVRKAKAGLVVEPESPAVLADAIQYLASRPDLRDQFGASARRYVVYHYSRQAIAAQYDHLLRQIVDRHSTSQPVRQA